MGQPLLATKRVQMEEAQFSLTATDLGMRTYREEFNNDDKSFAIVECDHDKGPFLGG